MKNLSLLFVLALVLVACGSGGSDEPDAPADTKAAPTTESATSDSGDSDDGDAPATTAASADDAPDVSDFTGEGQATVTLNGETYYFGDAGFPALQCMPDFFGVMIVFLQMVDESGNAGPDGSVHLILLREGTDPDEVEQLPEMSLNIDALDQEWLANEEHIEEFGLEPGTSQVDSVSFDGNSASGTATVYERNSYWAFTAGNADAVQTAQASFEVTCPEG